MVVLTDGELGMALVYLDAETGGWVSVVLCVNVGVVAVMWGLVGGGGDGEEGRHPCHCHHPP